MSSSVEDVKIKFDGQTHQISANTLINSLLHFTNIVQEVNREIASGSRVEVKVNALPEGSFLCHISVQSVLDVVELIFTKENLAVAKEIIDVVKNIYELSKFLKGKKPKSVEATPDKTVVTNNNGDTIIINNPVYNIYTNNRIVREAIAQEFETLENDVNVTGFELLDVNDVPLVQIDKSLFSEIASLAEDAIAKEDRILSRIGLLNIVRLSFERNMKWEFYFDGNKIAAKLTDEEFVKLIDAGESFAKGDALEAELEIRQEFDGSVNAFVNKSYKINRIIRHIPRPRQQNLNFPKG